MNQSEGRRFHDILTGVLTASPVRVVLVAAFLVLPWVGVTCVRAQTFPGAMNFQGRLTDASNNPLSGGHNLAFALYDASSGGTLLWSETQNGVSVVNGVFAVQLGAGTPLSALYFYGPDRWLQVTVDGTPLTPREKLAAAPFAFNAGALDGRSYLAFVSTDTTAQSIAGAKTFTGALSVPAPTLFAGAAADPAGSAGALYYNSASNKLRLHIGTGFVDIATGTVGAGGGAAYTADEASLHLAGAQFSALSSSVTLQGNSFNAADRLVKLDASGRLPAVNASLLTNLPAASGPVAPQYVDLSTVTTALNLKLTSGAVPSGFVDLSTVTAALSLKLTSGPVPADFIDLSTVAAALLGKVDRSGDGMTGPLTMLGNSTVTVKGDAFSVGGATFTVASGLIGMGTNAPGAQLHAKAGVGYHAAILETANGGPYPLILRRTDAPGQDVNIYNNGAQFWVQQGAYFGGSVGVGVQAPAARLHVAGGDLQVGDATASTIAAAGYLALANLSAAPAAAPGRLYYDTNGEGALMLRLNAGGFVAIATGSAGAGLSSVNAEGAQFTGLGTGVSPLTLQSSSVTLQGNLFNAADRLVKLDGSNRLPAVNASLLTNLPAASAPVAPQYVDLSTVTTALNLKLTSGAVPSAFIDFSTITIALGLKLTSGAVPSNFIDLSTVTSALALKLDAGAAIAAGSVDFSTITTALNLKLTSGAVPSGFVDLSTVTSALALKLDAGAALPQSLVDLSTVTAALNLKLTSGAVPADFIDLSTVTSALALKLDAGTAIPSNLVNLSTITTALNLKLTSGAVPSGFVDLSTVTSALALKLDAGAAIPPNLVNLSTVTTALNLKLTSGAIPSGFIDLSTVTTALSLKLTSGPVPADFVDLSTVTAALDGKVTRAGDGMTGPLTMLGNSTITVLGDAFSVGGTTFTVANGRVGLGVAAPGQHGDRLTIGAVNAANEGGQIGFEGGGSNRYFYIDNYSGNMRIVTQDSPGESEKFRFNNDGAMGVGTGIPAARLHVSSANALAADAVLLVSSGTGQGQELLVVKGDGKVGVGKSDPAAMLDVAGVIRTSGSRVESLGVTDYHNQGIRMSSGTPNLWQLAPGNGFFSLSMWNGSTWKDWFNVDATGRLGIGSTTPGAQLQSVYTLTGVLPDGVAYFDNRGANVDSTLKLGDSTVNSTRFILRALNDSDGDAGGATDVFVVKADGKVGIGTGTPAAVLDIQSPLADSQGKLLRFTSAGTEWLKLTRLDATSTALLQSAQNISLQPTGGNVGIGTTTPGVALSVEREMLINGNLASGTEYTDWPRSSLAIRRSDDYVLNGVTMMSFGYRNDPLYLVDDSVANIRIYDPSQAPNAGTSAATTQLRIASPGPLVLQPASGNVGIGVSVPTARLHIGGTAGVDGIRFPDGTLQTSAVTGGGGISNAGDTSIAADSDADGVGVITLATHGSERMRVANGGNVGIGETNPGSLLHLKSSNGGTLFMEYPGNTNAFIGENSLGQLLLGFGTWQQSNSKLTLQAGGDAGLGTVYPTARLHVSSASAAAADTVLLVSSGTSTGQELFVVKGDGKAGFGTAAPSRRLHVRSADGMPMMLENDGGGNVVLEMKSMQNAQRAINFLDKTGSAVSQIGVWGAADGVSSMTFNTSGATRMKIDENGNVGIGTGDPAGRLHVNLGADKNIAFNTDTSGGTNESRISAHNDAVSASRPLYINGSYLGLQVSGAEKVRLDSAGNLGIGDAAPASKLTVNGDMRIKAGSGGQLIFADGTTMATANTGSASALSNAADAIVTGDSDASGGGDVVLKTGSNDRLHIANAGGVGVGTASPDPNGLGTRLNVAGAAASPGREEITGNTADGDAVNTGDLFFSAASQTGATLPQGGTRLAGLRAFTAGGTANNRGGALAINTKADNGSLAEAVRISSTGFVGVGTTAPSNRLHVVGGNSLAPSVNPNSPIVVEGTTANGNVNIQVVAANTKTSSLLLADPDSSANPGYSGALSYDHALDAMGFRTGANATYRMFIDAGGGVGVGTQTPYARLHVSSASAAASDTILLVSSGTTAGQELVVVMGDGRTGIGTTAPDGFLHVKGGNTNVVFSSSTAGAGQASAQVPGMTFTGASGIGQPSWDGNTRFTYNASGFVISHNGGGIGQPGGPRGFGLGTSGREGDLFISSGGAVGVGTVLPYYLLHVSTGAGEPGDLLAVSTGTSDVFRVNGQGEVRANKYYGDGSQLTGISGGSDRVLRTGDGMTGPLTMLESSTITVKGDAFSVGGSTLVVRDGRVGIGTPSPAAALDVKGSGSGHVMIGAWTSDTSFGGVTMNGTLDNGGNGLFNRNNYALVVNRQTGQDIGFKENFGANQMTVEASGRVAIGLGVQRAAARLHVSSANAVTTDSILDVSSGTSAGQELFVVKGDGRVGIGTAAPVAMLSISSGNVSFAKTFGIISEQGARLQTGPAGQTWQVWPGAVGAASFIANDLGGYTALHVSSQGYVGVGGGASYRFQVSTGAGESGNILVVSTGNADVFRVTGEGEVFANKLHGDGSALTGLPGAVGKVDKSGDGMTGPLTMQEGSSITVKGHLLVDGYSDATRQLRFHDVDAAASGGVGLFAYATGIHSDALAVHGQTGVSLRTNATERLYIDVQGSVGMGSNYTGSHGDKLTLGALDSGDEGGQLGFEGAASNRYFYIDNWGGHMRFVTQDTAGESVKLQLNNDGRLGVGTANPAARLHVSSANAVATDTVFQVSSGPAWGQELLQVKGDGKVIVGPGDATTTLTVRSRDDMGRIDISGPGNAWNYSGFSLLSNDATPKYWGWYHRKVGGETNNLLLEEFDGTNYKQRMVMSPDGTVDFSNSTGKTQFELQGIGDAFNYTNMVFWNNDWTRYWAMMHRKDGGDVNKLFFEEFNGATYNTRMTLAPGGNAGIGTTAPAARLHVSSGTGESGDILIVSTGSSNVFRVSGQGEVRANKYYGDGSQLTGVSGGSDRVIRSGDGMTGPLTMLGNSTITVLGDAFSVGGSTLVITNGWVGIGTPSPAAALDVKGSGAGHVMIGAWTSDTAFGGVSMNGSLGNNGNGLFNRSNYALVVNREPGQDIAFKENFGANQMAVEASGRVAVGLGIQRAVARLHVSSANAVATDTLFLVSSGTSQGQELVAVKGSGNIGIGTLTPGGRLSVQGTGTSSVLFVSSDSAGTSGSLVVDNNGNTALQGALKINTDGLNASTRFLRLSSYGQDGVIRINPGNDSTIYLNRESGVARDLHVWNGQSNDLLSIIGGSGNVGIGTTNPASKLHISSSTAGEARIALQDTSGAGTRGGSITGSWSLNGLVLDTLVGDNATHLYYGSSNGNLDQHHFYADGAERVTISSQGYVGIGTTTPLGVLHVASGQIIGKTTSNTGTSINFLSGNLQYTSQSCSAGWNLYNMKDGASYSLAVQGTSVGTCGFSAYSDSGATSLTMHLPPDHGATTTGKHTVYTFIVLGTHVYASWIPGY